MALPPTQGDDRSEAFIREVDENLRRDQMADAAQRHGRWVLGALLVALAAVGAWFLYAEQQKKQAAADSEAIATNFDRLQPGRDNGAVVAGLDQVAADGAKGSRGPALLGKAAVEMSGGNARAAAATYARIAADDSIEQPYRDLALLRRVMIDYDKMTPDAVIEALKPLAVPENGFFGTAGELTASAMLAKGDKAGAGRMFAAIAADAKVPASLRARAAQYAGTLGIDASASLAAPQ